MPLEENLRASITEYCDRDVSTETQVGKMFEFVEDSKLKEMLVDEYMAARYIYKLGEALFADRKKISAHTKFQIVQYASIYEAVIVHLLWSKYAEHPEVKAIEKYTSLAKTSQFPSDISMCTSEGKKVLLCIEKEMTNSRQAIKFDDKVAAAVKIGFLEQTLGEELKGFFKLRNGVHIENAVKNDISYEMEKSKLAYWRMQPFLDGISKFLAEANSDEGLVDS